MGKFKVDLEIQGLKLRVEGSSEDAPMIASNLNRQFSGLIGPAIAIVEGQAPDGPLGRQQALPAGTSDAAKRRSRTKRRTSAEGETADKPSPAIDWRNDVEKFGVPSQSWTAVKKAIWLLWALSQQTTHHELTRFQIVETFNKHFKSAGLLIVGNVQRDLSKEKLKRPPRVSEDTSPDPSLWFLTDTGKKFAQELVVEALGGKPAEEAESPESPE